MIFNIFLTIFLVLLNGFFVAAEFAIVKVRSSQIELRAQAGNRMAKLAQHMITHLDAYLSATQLGITLASLGLGWIGESVVSQIIINLMAAFGFEPSPEVAHSIALPIAFALITVLHIVFGELAPKSLAIQRPESTTLAIALPLRFFYIVFIPFIWLLNGFSNFILRSMGIRSLHGSEVHSAEELRLLFEQSAEGGAIQDSQHELIENVFQFNERMVKQILVPRTKMVAIDSSISEHDLMEIIFNEGYSRLPVYSGNIDNIVGVLYVKDLLSIIRMGEPVVLEKLIRPAYFVPETKKINRLLKQFQRRHMHIAIVTDEFGGVSGIVTMEDIIEELVGEIQDEYDEEVPLVELVSDYEYKVSASAPISDANDFLPYPLPEGEDYETVGGLVSVLYGQIPEDISDTIDFNEYEISVLEKSERSLISVLFRIKEDMREEAIIKDMPEH
ncbi:HlyC/CorC family transporter [Pontibacter sp. BT310]|uniref:Hemolysin family protein n=1 Tax=Pontibacter populi TaxID=890055 RepID=A0ABS6XEK3_9BACT|nr:MULTISPECIES: hemolysin family protein [Pontibacter]MBJ6119532.1 HlyC/CorC family transporter [Pontibacter sp. BT310]MBR0571959.1 HlyC/CorC family transporter [Microvirga sp. STS03]MBW3366385.1 hemolysin family protein [Pontibacter populi]